MADTLPLGTAVAVPVLNRFATTRARGVATARRAIPPPEPTRAKPTATPTREEPALSDFRASDLTICKREMAKPGGLRIACEWGQAPRARRT